MKDSFNTLTYAEMLVKREELRKKYFEFRFQMVIGHVDNPLEKRNLRRKLARITTRIHLHELAEKKAKAGGESK